MIKLRLSVILQYLNLFTRSVILALSKKKTKGTHYQRPKDSRLRMSLRL